MVAVGSGGKSDTVIRFHVHAKRFLLQLWESHGKGKKPLTGACPGLKDEETIILETVHSSLSPRLMPHRTTAHAPATMNLLVWLVHGRL